MIKQLISLSTIAIAFCFLTGCASQEVKLSENFWHDSKQKVVVAATKAPTPQLYKEGQQGVLDYAVNAAMTSDLEKHLEKTDESWYQDLPQTLSDQLKKRNIYTQAYLNPLTSKQINYVTSFDADKVLVIELKALGATRRYYSVIPITEPEAYCVLSGELIDTKSKKVLWRHTTNIVEPVKGPWDQPPTYPNLSNAVQVAIKSAQEDLMNNLLSGH